MTIFHKIYVSKFKWEKILERRTVANLHLDFLFTYTHIYLSISLFWDEFLCSPYLTTSLLFDFVISAIISMCPNNHGVCSFSSFLKCNVTLIVRTLLCAPLLGYFFLQLFVPWHHFMRGMILYFPYFLYPHHNFVWMLW